MVHNANYPYTARCTPLFVTDIAGNTELEPSYFSSYHTAPFIIGHAFIIELGQSCNYKYRRKSNDLDNEQD